MNFQWIMRQQTLCLVSLSEVRSTVQAHVTSGVGVAGITDFNSFKSRKFLKKDMLFLVGKYLLKFHGNLHVNVFKPSSTEGLKIR